MQYSQGKVPLQRTLRLLQKVQARGVRGCWSLFLFRPDGAWEDRWDDIGDIVCCSSSQCPE